MARTQYIEKKFRQASLDRIEQANEIMTKYAEDGYDLTLRQLYYQFVSRDLLPNTQREYKNLGSLVNDARLAGLLDWNHLIDRTRSLYGKNHDSSPENALYWAARSYSEDKWEQQDAYVECWVEKEALAGVIGGAASSRDVNYFACKGYSSASAMYKAAQRLKGYLDEGKTVVVLYLGDHDPSGLDMDRDISERLATMGAGGVEVRRIALTWDQVQHYKPPPNPTKTTDSRSADYIDAYGHESWELDALEPAVLEDLIKTDIDEIRDEYLWQSAQDDEKKNRDLMELVSDNWSKVIDYLQEEE